MPIARIYTNFEAGETEELSWEYILWDLAVKMQSEPESYKDWGEDSLKGIRLSYGLLQNGNWPAIGESHEKNEPFRKGTLNEIYRSPELQEAAYRWAMPAVAASFAQMPEVDQKGYLEIASHTRRYLGEFNYAEERDYYQTLAKATCPNSNWFDAGTNCVRYFTQYGPSNDWKVARKADADDNWNARPEGDRYRKAEAWVFRRVNEGDMTPGELRTWVGRIERDLRKAAAN